MSLTVDSRQRPEPDAKNLTEDFLKNISEENVLDMNVEMNKFKNKSIPKIIFMWSLEYLCKHDARLFWVPAMAVLL